MIDGVQLTAPEKLTGTSKNWVWETPWDFNAYAAALCADSGFGPIRGRDIGEAELAFFILLSSRLRAKSSLIPLLFRSPVSATTISLYGGNFMIRSCLCFWTGRNLFIISSCDQGSGAYSVFRRAFKVPVKVNAPLNFYGFLTPVDASDLSEMRCLYEVAASVCLSLYDFLQPNLYHASQLLINKIPGRQTFPVLLTRFMGSWSSLRSLIRDPMVLSQEKFLAIIQAYIALWDIQNNKVIHGDFSCGNVVLLPLSAGAYPIDWETMRKSQFDTEISVLRDDQTAAYFDPTTGPFEQGVTFDGFSVSLELLMLLMQPDHLPTVVSLLDPAKQYHSSGDSFTLSQRKQHYADLFFMLSCQSDISEGFSALQIMPGFDVLKRFITRCVEPDVDARPLPHEVLLEVGVEAALLDAIVMMVQSFMSNFHKVSVLLEHLSNLARLHLSGVAYYKPVMYLMMYALHSRSSDCQALAHQKQVLDNMLSTLTTIPSNTVCRDIQNYYDMRFPSNILLDTVVASLFDEVIADITDSDVGAYALIEIVEADNQAAMRPYHEGVCKDSIKRRLHGDLLSVTFQGVSPKKQRFEVSASQSDVVGFSC